MDNFVLSSLRVHIAGALPERRSKFAAGCISTSIPNLQVHSDYSILKRLPNLSAGVDGGSPSVARLAAYGSRKVGVRLKKFVDPISFEVPLADRKMPSISCIEVAPCTSGQLFLCFLFCSREHASR